ncbi:MAG: hypothetical protein ABUT20_51165 [Bacteroidota bacterium]
MKQASLKPVSLKNQLKKGLDLSFKKLVESKKINDGVLIFSRNGKIVKVKARDIK